MRLEMGDGIFLHGRHQAVAGAGLDVGDFLVDLNGQEAKHRLLEPQLPLKIPDGLPLVEVAEDPVVTLLELVDLVGELFAFL